jgi:hypothetical protein
MYLNPTAVLFWAITSAVGYLIAGSTGAILGFIISGTISLILSVE